MWNKYKNREEILIFVCKITDNKYEIEINH